MAEPKAHAVEDVAGLADEVRAYLRTNAPQVRTFEIDRIFTGRITCVERVDKWPAGYERVEQVFDSFDDLKEYYDPK